ncbi:Transmembrane protein [Plantibacter sp. RU18]
MLPLPFLAIVLVVVILSRWGGLVIAQVIVSTFRTAILMNDSYQDASRLALTLAAIWAAVAINATFYVRHVARRQRSVQTLAGPTFDITPYRRRNKVR